MRINEITRPPTKGDALRVLKDAGYDLIGYGQHGYVFKKYGSPLVLRLFGNEDKGFPWFVHYAQTNPSIHWPRNHGPLMRITDDYSAVRMENLDELGNNADIGWRLHKYARQISANGEHTDNVDDLPPTLLADLAKLTLAVKNTAFLIDLDVPGNVMERGPTVVLVDPVTMR